MTLEDKAILSTFIETFKSFQLGEIKQPLLSYDPNARVIFADVNEPFFNSLCIKHPTDNVNLIEELQDLHRLLNKQLTVWITAETEAPGLEEQLQKNFYSPGPFYGMILDIDGINLPAINKDIQVRLVENSMDAASFAKIYCEVFNFTTLQSHTEKWAILQAKLDNATCLNYIAGIDGIDVGVSSLVIDRSFNECKVGGFYNACVLPKYRNLGVAMVMACSRIKMARNLGLKYLSILLMSDAMARGYCEKLGFKDCQTMTPYYIK